MRARLQTWSDKQNAVLEVGVSGIDLLQDSGHDSPLRGAPFAAGF